MLVEHAQDNQDRFFSNVSGPRADSVCLPAPELIDVAFPLLQPGEAAVVGQVPQLGVDVPCQLATLRCVVHLVEYVDGRTRSVVEHEECDDTKTALVEVAQ